MSALDEIRKIPYQKRTKLELAVIFYGDTPDNATDLANAEEAAAELLKLREELYTVKHALYLAQESNNKACRAYEGAWARGSRLYETIEKALNRFRPNAN